MRVGSEKRLAFYPFLSLFLHDAKTVLLCFCSNSRSSQKHLITLMIYLLFCSVKVFLFS